MSNIILTKFYRYEEMEKLLLGLADAYPEYMRLSSLTKTPEGREVYLATLADFSLGEQAENRGAYFIQAGLHSQEVSGPVAAMAVIERILKQCPDILRETVFYIVPNVNPDGMELAMSASFRGIRSRLRKIPGLPNAIIPSDINQDGMILNMRRKSALGNMKELSGHPGIMVKREPGETDGEFYDMWVEGLIENYDGGEPVLGVERMDFNRCYPSRWEATLGKELPLYPPEIRAVVEFETTHKNIFAGVDFHNGAAAILTSVCPGDGKPQEDVKVIKEIASIASDITGLRQIGSGEYQSSEVQPFIPRGTSAVWGYEGFGRSQYTIELGVGLNAIGMSTDEILQILAVEEDLQELSIKRLCAHKEFWNKYGSEILVPWREFDHPQLGIVEVGGLRGGNALYYFGEYIGCLLPKVVDFTLLHAGMTPKLMLGNVRTDLISDGVYRIRASLLNAGRLGTTVMQGGGKTNAQSPVYVTIDGNNINVVSTPATYGIEQLKSGEKVEFEWFVKAEAGSELTVCAKHPKSADSQITIRL